MIALLALLAGCLPLVLSGVLYELLTDGTDLILFAAVALALWVVLSLLLSGGRFWVRNLVLLHLPLLAALTAFALTGRLPYDLTPLAEGTLFLTLLSAIIPAPVQGILISLLSPLVGGDMALGFGLFYGVILLGLFVLSMLSGFVRRAFDRWQDAREF